MNTTRVRYVLCEDPAEYAASLTPRRVYTVIPDPAEANGMLRVIDDTGEDYLFEADLFREIENLTGVATEVTVGLTWPMKAAIHQPELRGRLKAPARNPEQALYVSGALKTTRVMVKDEDVCLHCGLCAERCPTGAWDMQKFLFTTTKAGPLCRDGTPKDQRIGVSA